MKWQRNLFKYIKVVQILKRKKAKYQFRESILE